MRSGSSGRAPTRVVNRLLSGSARHLHVEQLEARRLLAVINLTPGAADGSPGSLRAALLQVASNSDASNTINLAAGAYFLNNTNDGDLLVNNASALPAKTLTIAGAGAAGTIVGAAGGWNDRIFQILSSPTASVAVTIKDLTVSGGNAKNSGSQPGTGAFGGGIFIDGGQVALTNVIVLGNKAAGAPGAQGAAGHDGIPAGSGQQGGEARGGGIYLAAGALTLNPGTIVVNNSAVGGAGGAGGTAESFSGSAGAPGANGPAGASGGDGGNGGNAFGGGIYVLTGSVALNGATLQSNSATGGKGGNGPNGQNAIAGAQGSHGIQGGPGANGQPGQKGGNGGKGGDGGDGGSGGDAGGGAIYLATGIANFSAVTIVGNSATGGKAGAGGQGGLGQPGAEGGAGGGGGQGDGAGAGSLDGAAGANGARGGHGGNGGAGGNGGNSGNGGNASGGGLLVGAGAVSIQLSSFTNNAASGGNATAISAFGGVIGLAGKGNLGAWGAAGGNGGGGGGGGGGAAANSTHAAGNGGHGGLGGEQGAGGDGGNGGNGGRGGDGGAARGGGIAVLGGAVTVSLDTIFAASNSAIGGNGGAAAAAGDGGAGGNIGTGRGVGGGGGIGGAGGAGGGILGPGGNGGAGGAGGAAGNGGNGGRGGRAGSAIGGSAFGYILGPAANPGVAVPGVAGAGSGGGDAGNAGEGGVGGPYGVGIGNGQAGSNGHVGQQGQQGLDGTQPRVSDVLIGNADWTQPFLSALIDLGHGASRGYQFSVGSAAQMDVLPWSNLNRISIVFTTNVSVTKESLSLAGVENPDNAIDTFTYDPGSLTATWTLSSMLPPDRYTLHLASTGSHAVKDAQASPLDGEWIDKQSVFPSGDGAPGGDFDFGFNVLPGSVNQDGSVNAQDIAMVGSHWLQAGGMAGDANGDGVVNAQDIAVVATHWLQTLPAAGAGSSAPLSAQDNLAAADADPASTGDVVALVAQAPALSNDSVLAGPPAASDAPEAPRDSASAGTSYYLSGTSRATAPIDRVLAELGAADPLGQQTKTTLATLRIARLGKYTPAIEALSGPGAQLADSLLHALATARERDAHTRS